MVHGQAFQNHLPHVQVLQLIMLLHIVLCYALLYAGFLYIILLLSTIKMVWIRIRRVCLHVFGTCAWCMCLCLCLLGSMSVSVCKRHVNREHVLYSFQMLDTKPYTHGFNASYNLITLGLQCHVQDAQ